ncbi:MAG: TIGR02597 family protein [Opitutaceae bacterium]
MKPMFALAVASLTASSYLLAGTSSVVATDPVGYVTTTTPDGDDALIGLPLTRSAALSGAASGVDGAQVGVSSTLVVDAYNNTHYALATSGANAGQWSEIVDTDVGSFTTAEALLADTDTFDVIPFWTLATAFPGGDGVGASANPSSPSSTVLLNNLSAAGTNLSSAASYLYFAGPSPSAGWYQTGSFAPSDDVRLSPETYLTIRNSSGAELTTVVSGSVPTTVVGTAVVRGASLDQDNQVTNPYPAVLTLATSGLTDVVGAAANPSSPVDTVILYDPDNTTGQNISSAASYLYFAGPSPAAGWYQTGSFAPSDNVEIPAGGAIIIRKGSGADEEIAWNPPVPYSL